MAKRWVRIDVDYLTHPKLRRAGADGTLLHLASVLYLAEHDIDDGLLPTEAVPVIAATAYVPKHAPVVRRLLDVGLWHTAAHGYVVHDFDVLNGARSEAALARERQRRKRDRDRLRLVDGP